MAIPRFKDVRVGPRERRRVSADPAASRGRTPGRRVGDGPAELNEKVHPVIADGVPDGVPDVVPHVVSEADIPVLTDVVEIPADEAPAASPSPAAAEGDLERRLADDVLQRLMRHGDDLLAAQLQNEMAPVMERLAATLARELREPLTQMIREVVARAVIEELTRSRPRSADRSDGADIADRSDGAASADRNQTSR